MKLFRGGIHPDDRKLSADSPIETLPPPAKAVLPLAHHTGSPAKSLVKAKDPVKVGQPVAEAGGFVSAWLHSPVSGKVTAIDHAPHASGLYLESIIIESDGLDERFEATPRDYKAMTPEEILDVVKRSGVVGLGGASFPTHVKLSPPKDKPIDTIILNGCECEPYLTCDHRVMFEETGAVLEGLAILMKALNVNRGIVAIEENKADAIRALTEGAARFPGIEVRGVPTRYPQGGEKQLIYALLKREVPSGGLPMHVGCVVQNVQTAAAIRRAVIEDMPLVERVVTVTGRVKTPKNLRVRIGTPIEALIQAAGGLDEDAAEIIGGGPMTGPSLYSLAFPVMKGTSGIVALSVAEAAARVTHPCIRCGRCIAACPMGLMPTTLAQLAERQGDAAAGEIDGLHAMDCIECASCAYECPSRIELLQLMKLAKAVVRKAKAKAKTA
jgi:electron transport complex protein RnfC